jgi:hypothetical protein
MGSVRRGRAEFDSAWVWFGVGVGVRSLTPHGNWFWARGRAEILRMGLVRRGRVSVM